MHKKLGQHFLRSKQVIHKIAHILPIHDSDTIVEVGPGTGSITEQLICRQVPVLAIEKDAALVSRLQEKFSSAIAKHVLTLCCGDVRDSDWRDLIQTPSFIVVANIPYYLTSSLIQNLLTHSQQPRAMALIVQKEVADRIVSKNKKESILSLSVKLFGDVQYIQTIRKSSFSPPPRISSALIIITNITSIDSKLERAFFYIIHKAFHQKRKMVLKKFTDEPHIQKALLACGVEPSARPEDIPFSIWLSVATSIT